MNRARHFFLLQFATGHGEDITLTTTDDDLADQLINGDGTGFTPWMETAYQDESKRFHIVEVAGVRPLSRANLLHVVLMAHTVGREAQA